MKQRLDENLTNDSVDNSILLGTKKRIVEEVEIDDTMSLRGDNWVTNPIFYEDDFIDENMKEFWEDEFIKARNLKGKALKSWAKDMLEYIDDFARDYVRDEVANTLQAIVDNGIWKDLFDECDQKKAPIKEAEGMYAKLNKWIADTEAEIAEKKKQLKATDDDDEKDILMNDISNLEIHLGDLEAQLDELDYIDNGDPALRSYYEAMEQRLDEKDEDTEEVEWEVIWHPEEWDMQEHDANIESFDDFEKYKARLKELKDGNEPIIIVSANSYNKDGEIVRMDLDMTSWDEDEFDFDDEEDDVDESLNEGDVGDVQVDEVVDIIDNPLDELPNSIEPIFEFESGNYVFIGWDENSKSLIAGGATNTGIIPEFELKYDFDMSLDDNLQELYDKIITEHPEYLEPVDGNKGDGEEIEAKVEVEEESLKEDKPPVVHDFCDDEEKMADFKKLSKDEFLKMYSYLTPEEYEATVKACAKKESLEESSSDVRPTEEQKKLGREDDWGEFEVEHGYGEFQVGWDYAPLNIISRIDIMDVFPGDLEAVEQAKRDGFKFMDLGDDFFDDFFDILPEQVLDTEENRKNIEYYIDEDPGEEPEIHLATSDFAPGQWYESYLKEERDLSKIEGTISKFLDDNSAELFAGITGDTKKDKINLAQNAIKLLQKAIDDKLIADSEIPHAKENIIKISNDLRHNKLNGMMSLVTSLLTGKALEKPVDECKKSDTVPVEEEKKMTEEEVKEIKEEDDLPDTDDEEGAPKQKYYNKLNELEHMYSDDAYHVIEMVLEEMDDSSYDIGDLIAQELDNACIYYKDCWDYLWKQNITEFKDAINEGATNLCGIAYHYLAEEVYDLASKIGLDW